jgi:HD-like signal output (HDOD) protein
MESKTLVDRKVLLSKLHQLPSLPLVLQELIASFSNADLDTASLAHKIEHDQGLSAKVLRMANSSFYGLTRKVGSIQDAVTVLGFDTVRSLVLSTGIIRLFPPSPDSLFDRQAYWQHCFRVATISKGLAQNLQQGQQLAFTAGMFCEIGQLVLDLCIPQQFSELLQKQASSELSLIELERSELGFDHFDIGADIIRLWNFPLEIEQLIRYWNTPELQTTPNPLTCVVHIATLLDSGVTGDELMSKMSETWCAHLKLTWEQIEANLPDSEQLEGFYQHE